MSSSDEESGYESPEQDSCFENYNNFYKHPGYSDATSGVLTLDRYSTQDVGGEDLLIGGWQSVPYDQSTAVRADDPTLTKRKLQQVKESAVVTVIEKLNEMQALVPKIAVPGSNDDDEKVEVQKMARCLRKALDLAKSALTRLQKGAGEAAEVSASTFLDLVEYTRYWVLGIHIHLKTILDSELHVMPADIRRQLVERDEDCRVIVWSWPPLQVAERLEFLIEASSMPRKGLLRSYGRSAWVKDGDCECDPSHGDDSAGTLEIPITIRTATSAPRDDAAGTLEILDTAENPTSAAPSFQCLSPDGDDYDRAVISKDMQRTFLAGLHAQIRPLVHRDQEQLQEREKRLLELYRKAEDKVSNTVTFDTAEDGSLIFSKDAPSHPAPSCASNFDDMMGLSPA